MKSDQTVQCDVLTHCTNGCSVHTLPSVIGKFISRQPKLVLNSEKNHDLSDREECQEFQLLVVQLLRFQVVDEDECDRVQCDS